MSRNVTPNALFVYGTLMRGESNHGLLRGAVQFEDARVPGRLFKLPAGYPALVAGEGTVFGELAFFDELSPHLPAIDAYEDCDPADPKGSLYRRLRCEATRRTGERIEAWCYVMETVPKGAVLIPSGRWKDA